MVDDFADPFIVVCHQCPPVMKECSAGAARYAMSTERNSERCPDLVDAQRSPEVTETYDSHSACNSRAACCARVSSSPSSLLVALPDLRRRSTPMRPETGRDRRSPTRLHPMADRLLGFCAG